MSGAALELHLEETVLGVDVALGEEQVVFVFGKNLGRPESVAQNLHLAAEAAERNGSFERGQRAAKDGSQRGPGYAIQEFCESVPEEGE